MNDDQLHAMRHSAAHVLAAAVMRLWPEAKLGIGPVVEDGFYYDIDLGETKISDEDFPKITKEMKKIISANESFERTEMPVDEALAWAESNNQTYKQELLNDLRRAGTTVASDLSQEELGTVTDGDGAVDAVTFYTNGAFKDLCRGPHAESTAKIGAFKLMRVAGAYWRGDENKAQMQRVYGLAFETKEQLNAKLSQLEQAKKRDHRIVGKKLDLFTISAQVGSGLPMFTPRGTVLRDLLGDYSQQLRKVRGFERVWTPHITKNDLYKTSGHWEKFGDELFLVESQETSDSFVMKPMNCPHHIQIYDSQPRSYKDLPIKYMENATDYRDEKSGELHGLSRVRAFTQDDCHAFCRSDQIEEVANDLIGAAKELYKAVEMDLRIELSFRDDKKTYLGDKSVWDDAEARIEAVAKKNNMDYKIVPGEAAFYGPKIDFRAVDAIGRDWQLATVQFDFIQPSRFELNFINDKGEKETPVMVHSALLGSIERFLSIYIEHVDGRFPFWLAPEQIRVVPVGDDAQEYVDKVTTVLSKTVLMSPLKYNELRFSVDASNESLGKRIRAAETMKVPLVLIVGAQDREANEVSIRTHAGESKIKLSELNDFIANL